MFSSTDSDIVDPIEGDGDGEFDPFIIDDETDLPDDFEPRPPRGPGRGRGGRGRGRGGRGRGRGRGRGGRGGDGQ